MIIEAGHFALVLALVVALIQAVVPWWGADVRKPGWMMVGRRAAGSVFGLLAVAFFTLMHAYALTDLSVANVAQNSHTLMPPVYKLTAVWGNHEGSMLLWVLLLAFWGYLVARLDKSLDPVLQARALSFHGLLVAGFCLFILLASNPFARLIPPAPSGQGLNPILQDLALAAHPPMLYMGYVGFSVVFCLALAALWERRIDRDFAKHARLWALASWAALTAGITLGSFWAYYELGWGGFWFWDPVENCSLMPWLAGGALVHSLAVLEKRDTLKNWVVFLSMLAFILSLLGTFLVRSGLLTSVHAFASDPMRGIFILGLMGIYTGGAFLLYALRAPASSSGSTFSPVSRENLILVNNVFLFTFTMTILVGTLYPLILEALDLGGIAVGPSYYVMTLLPLLVPFALLLGSAPFVSWGRAEPAVIFKKLWPALFAMIAAMAVLAGYQQFEKPLGILGIGLFIFIVITTMIDIRAKRMMAGRPPLRWWGMTCAHLGFAVLILGVSGASQWKEERTVWMEIGQTTQIAGIDVTLDSMIEGTGPDYNFERGVFSTGDAILTPEQRWYPVAGQETIEVGLRPYGVDLLYVAIGERDQDRVVVRLYYHPVVLLIFMSGLMIACGTVLSMIDRRKT